MKSIVVTYPDFRELPRGVKQLLVATENFFFSEAQSHPVRVDPGGTELFEHCRRKMNDPRRSSVLFDASSVQVHWQVLE